MAPDGAGGGTGGGEAASGGFGVIGGTGSGGLGAAAGGEGVRREGAFARGMAPALAEERLVPASVRRPRTRVTGALTRARETVGADPPPRTSRGACARPGFRSGRDLPSEAVGRGACWVVSVSTRNGAACFQTSAVRANVRIKAPTATKPAGPAEGRIGAAMVPEGPKTSVKRR